MLVGDMGLTLVSPANRHCSSRLHHGPSGQHWLQTASKLHPSASSAGALSDSPGKKTLIVPLRHTHMLMDFRDVEMHLGQFCRVPGFHILTTTQPPSHGHCGQRIALFQSQILPEGFPSCLFQIFVFCTETHEGQQPHPPSLHGQHTYTHCLRAQMAPHAVFTHPLHLLDAPACLELIGKLVSDSNNPFCGQGPPDARSQLFWGDRQNY